MAQQAKDLDWTYISIWDGIYSQELLDIAGEELEGAYMTCGITEDDPALKEYQKEFQKSILVNR